MTITADEARALAKQFRDLSIEVGNYRWDNDADLTEDQRTKLDKKERRLMDAAADMVEEAIDLDLAAANTSVAGLTGVTGQVKETIKTLQQVTRVIELATISVQLAAAISTQNPAAIATSLGALSDKVDQIANA